MKCPVITPVTIALIVVAIATFSYPYLAKKSPPIVQAQKFRFGEQCPDGLRVEYISTIRLPKSVICQQAVGE